MRFVKYGKKLAENDEEKIDYKNRLDIKKRAKEISEIELRMWYEDSLFTKVSGVKYSEHIARTKYELFLEKDEKYISKNLDKNNVHKQKEIHKKKYDDDNDDDENDNKPLFTIQFKK